MKPSDIIIEESKHLAEALVTRGFMSKVEARAVQPTLEVYMLRAALDIREFERKINQ